VCWLATRRPHKDFVYRSGHLKFFSEAISTSLLPWCRVARWYIFPRFGICIVSRKIWQLCHYVQATARDTNAEVRTSDLKQWRIHLFCGRCNISLDFKHHNTTITPFGYIQGYIQETHILFGVQQKIMSNDTNREASTSQIISRDTKFMFCVNRP
jgi:hypothetical protein